MISCILLSAGLSKRFCSPKALAQISENLSVIEQIQHTLISSSLDEVILVLGAHSQRIIPQLLNHKRIRSVYNKNHNFGQTSSFKVGLENVHVQAKAVMLLPIDFPWVSVSTVNGLVVDFQKREPRILIPRYKNCNGHPPLLDISLKQELLNLSNENGLNTVAHRHCEHIDYWDCDDSGVIDSFNTQEEFAQIIEKRQQLL